MTKFQIIEDKESHGHIMCDEDTEREFPMCVIDGKKISWKDLGHELMMHEGFHFTLKVYEAD